MNKTASANAIATGAGVLHSVTVNSAVASQTITLFDSLTQANAKIATIGPTPASVQQPFTLIYDVEFKTGLSATLAVTADVTFSIAQ